MSADTLRRAAALMRERATVTGAEVDDWYTVTDLMRPEYDGGLPEADAAQVASWHPAVALAVADWLDATAAHVGSHDCEAHCEPDGCPQVLAALTVAHAYLGDP